MNEFKSYVYLKKFFCVEKKYPDKIKKNSNQIFDFFFDGHSSHVRIAKLKKITKQLHKVL